MKNRTRASGPFWLGVFVVAAFLFTPALTIRGGEPDPRADFERMLWAEQQTFSAILVEHEFVGNGQEVVNKFQLDVFQNRMRQKFIESNAEPAGEGYRGSDSDSGPADLETMPVPTFPDGLGNLDRLFRNWDVTPIGTKGMGEDAVTGYRLTPKFRPGYALEIAIGAKGPFVKYQEYGPNGKTRSVERLDLVFNPKMSPDTISDIQKKGRPNIGDTSGFGGERISAEEARRRLPGLLLPTSPILGFELDAIEVMTDGKTGKSVVFETFDDGLQRLVLAQTPASGDQARTAPPGSGSRGNSSGSSAPGTWTVYRRERSATGPDVYEWTMSNSVSCLFVSFLSRSQTHVILTSFADLQGQ